jgi:hypothetical protein
MSFLKGQMVYSKYDFKIRGNIIDIVQNIIANNIIENIYSIMDNKTYKIYKCRENHITLDPCEIIDILYEQVEELKNNYYNLKKRSNSI